MDHGQNSNAGTPERLSVPPGTRQDDRPHSADFLKEELRNNWWNEDFLALMGRRLRLEECHTVVDCGCGRGHWSRALAGTLHPDALVVGVDKEAAWIADAAASSQRAGLSHRFRYQQGFVEDLPFEEGSCDLMTCQTLLIHVPDPKGVLQEMLRVLKPGGLLLVAEPNNLSACLKWTSLRAEDFLFGKRGIDELLQLVRFHLLCEKGKQAIGEGLNSVGDLLPGYFAELGLDDIQVFQSDKASALFPPYASPEQRANVTDTLKRVEDGQYVWREEEARRYFLAGGGTAAEFSEFWQWALADNARLREALERRHYHAADGFSLYLVSGRKRLPKREPKRAAGLIPAEVSPRAPV